jgi:uncharacterized protein (DUF305 family)
MFTMKLCGGVLALALAVACVSAHAEEHQHGQAAAPSEASREYEAAMLKMHKDMSIPYTNDVDVDFVRGMIPHHQGAIAQAEVLLKHSKNPRLRRLAGGIIAAQRREIRFMLQWLKQHESGVESAEMPEWLKTAPETVEEAKRLGGSIEGEGR